MKQKKVIVLVAVVLVLVLSFSLFAACNKRNNDNAAATYTLHDYMGATPTNWNPHTWETNADSTIASYAEMGLVDVSIAANGVDFEWVYEMADSITDVTSQYTDKQLGGVAVVPEDVTEGQVYRIALNKNAKWANGEAITADTYVESMKRLLDPKMQNYRANTYYMGDTAIKNAKKYFNAGAPIYVPVASDDGYVDIDSLDLEDDSYYFSLSKASYFLGLSLDDLFGDTGYKSYWSTFDLPDFDEDGNLQYEEAEDGDYVLVDGEYLEYDAENPEHEGLDRYDIVTYSFYDKYAEIGETPFGVIKIDDIDTLIDELAIINGRFGDDNPEAWKEWVYYHDGYGAEYAWENVGLLKVDDYTIDYVLETGSASSEFYFLVSMTSNWLVYAPLYDSLKSQVGELFTTTYGTSVDTYMSYGPYKLSSFQKDKQLKFEKNNQWYGWNDGKHNGQFQTTDIVIDVVTNDATAENMFLAGQIDSLGLNSTQLAKYRTSEYLQKTDQTYTFRFVFATDKTKLSALNAKYGGGNLKILSYSDFRQALSLSIDRTKFAAQATGGYKPAYSLYSSLYYYDIENDTSSIYRRTDEAMQAICDLYNVAWGAGTNYPTLKEAYDSITGLDVAQAKALFQQAYTAAKEAGDYVDGDTVVIHCMASAAQELTEDDLAQERLLNEFVTAATVGTGLEGKVSFVFQCGSSTRYDDIAAGTIEMIRGAWGGAAFYPFSSIRVYTNPRYMKGLNKVHESCGWDPRNVNLTLTYDFDKDGDEDEVTMNLEQWSDSINGGLYDEENDVWTVPAYNDPSAKLYIMAKLELSVLESYQCIPWATETACTLFSKKLHYATLDYNIMYGYGGIRLMTYNYSDAEWAAYVQSQGGTLNY